MLVSWVRTFVCVLFCIWRRCLSVQIIILISSWMFSWGDLHHNWIWRSKIWICRQMTNWWKNEHKLFVKCRASTSCQISWTHIGIESTSVKLYWRDEVPFFHEIFHEILMMVMENAVQGNVSNSGVCFIAPYAFSKNYSMTPCTLWGLGHCHCGGDHFHHGRNVSS